VALAATLVLGACATPEEAEEEDEAAATTTTQPAEEVSVTARDYAFDGIPAQIDAGSKLTLKNASAKEVHEVIAVKLPESENRPVADLVGLPQADLEKLMSETATVLVALPNSDGMAVEGDGTLADAGRYMFVCFIPTGADPAAYQAAIQNPQGGPPNVSGGPPHATQGMLTEATVG
jgi:plastocyanin